MTVKIKDKGLYSVYRSLTWKTHRSEIVFDFLQGIYESPAVPDEDEIKKSIKAILDGEGVELIQQKYIVPLPHVFSSRNGQPLYLVKNDECGNFVTDSCPIGMGLQSKFVIEEIPEEYRQFAEKVED